MVVLLLGSVGRSLDTDDPELHRINYKPCGQFHKGIQSQFNDTPLHSDALTTHNPLLHPTYRLTTWCFNLLWFKLGPGGI